MVFESEQRLQTGTDEQLVAHEIPVPDPDGAGRRRQRVPLRTFLRRGLGTLAIGDVAHEREDLIVTAAHHPGFVVAIAVGQIHLVFDDDRPYCFRHSIERGLEDPEDGGRQDVAHVPAEESLSGHYQPAGIGRVVIEKDAVHRLEKHQIRNGAQEDAVQLFRLKPRRATVQ